MPTWYAKAGSAPHFQGQIFDVDSGETIAVTYNDEDATKAVLLAAAPQLVEAAEKLLEFLTGYDDDYPEAFSVFWDMRNAINQAKGNT